MVEMGKALTAQITRALEEWITALDVLKDPIFLHDESFRIIRCNKAYQRLAGLPFEQIIGRQYYDVFPKSGGPMPHCRRVKEIPHVASAEDEIKVGDTLFRSRSYAVNDETGEYRYAIHILEDITEQHNTEEMLLYEKNFTDKLIESIPDIFFLMDKEGHFLRWNKRVEQLLDLQGGMLKGHDALRFVHRKDRRQLRKQIVATFTGAGATSEARILTQKGIRHYALTSKRIDAPHVDAVIGIGIDITERKQTELLLQEERDFSERLIEMAPVIIMTFDPEGRITKINRHMEFLSGYTFAEVRNQDFRLFVDKAAYAAAHVHFHNALGGNHSQGIIGPLRTKSGKILQIEWYDKPLKNAKGETIGVLAIGMDVTERLASQEQLELFRALLDHSTDAIEILDPDTLRFLDVNETESLLLGYSRDELLHMSVFDIDPDYSLQALEETKKEIEKNGSVNFESIHRRVDGSTFPVEISTTLVELGSPYILTIARDITERQKTEAALQNEATRRRVLMESSLDGIAVFNQNHEIVEANTRFAEMLGYTLEELLKLHTWDFEAAMSEANIREAFEDLSSIHAIIETQHRRKDGTFYDAEVSLGGAMVGDEPLLFSITRDITERKEAEKSLKSANRALKTLSAGNLALVRAVSEEGLLRDVTKLIVKNGGYRLAAVIYAKDDPEKSLTPIAWAGYRRQQYWIQGLNWGKTEKGNFPTGLAVRNKKTQICREIGKSAYYEPWRRAAASRGYISCIALPLFENERVFGVLSIYASEPEPFDADEVHLLEELAGDLAYGILNLRTRVAHEQHEALLRDSLEQSIQAIAATVESRDPYTAGHQKRVAELSTAIGREMGLDDERLRALGFAGIIHDLGKIHIPAEILSKPGRLSDLEYKLIQTHPEAGYEIIKDIRFPWPIAQIILQHHERLDGSGYPNGLKGDAILLEAKIISVADTVDAIASHRPYRSARGIDVAMRELKNGSGSAFEPAVVDACVRLFTEKTFTFETESPLRMSD